ncbi:hypothetical protein D2U88_12240 [Flagellimonas aequoris]|uniref:Uncharacterized protein n=1 Tax=Flagellimonas aequoris TaxID=2306997 RepID=A0A418N698_9FLAO|nr:hypothetical protein D2U88_12240 [Allomuricauda aequoris]
MVTIIAKIKSALEEIRIQNPKFISLSKIKFRTIKMPLKIIKAIGSILDFMFGQRFIISTSIIQSQS